MVILERLRVQTIAGVSMSTIVAAVSRGRLVEAEAFELEKSGDGHERPGRLVKGITLASARAYWGWSPAAVDEILADHGLDPDADNVLLKAIFRKDVTIRSEYGEVRCQLYLVQRIRPVGAGSD